MIIVVQQSSTQKPRGTKLCVKCILRDWTDLSDLVCMWQSYRVLLLLTSSYVLACGNVNPYLLELLVFQHKLDIYIFKWNLILKCWIEFIKYSVCQAKCICMMVLSTSCQFASSGIGPKPVYNWCQFTLSHECWNRVKILGNVISVVKSKKPSHRAKCLSAESRE